MTMDTAIKQNSTVKHSNVHMIADKKENKHKKTDIASAKVAKILFLFEKLPNVKNSKNTSSKTKKYTNISISNNICKQ